jgi:hypothetical protein
MARALENGAEHAGFIGAPSHDRRESIEHGRSMQQSMTIGREYSQAGTSCQPKSRGALLQNSPSVTNSVPSRQGSITVRPPLLQSLYRRIANPAAGAANAHEEREEADACDEPHNVLTQLWTPYH